jgi:hypothetical protein
MIPDSVQQVDPVMPDLRSAVADISTRSSEPTKSHDANPIPVGVAYRDEIYQAAEAHHLDPMLLAAQAAQESGGPGANSGRNIIQQGGNGHGLFQLDPAGGYGPWLKAHHNGLNVKENADKAAAIDATNLKAYGGDTKAMLTVYNAGHNNDADTAVTTWPDGQRLHYAASVERHLDQLKQLAAEQH